MASPHHSINCAKCGHVLRVRSAPMPASVRCPFCQTETATAPRETVIPARPSRPASVSAQQEIQKIAFRCAGDGSAYLSVFARASPAEQFRYRAAEKVSAAAVQDAPPRRSGLLDWVGSKVGLGPAALRSFDAKQFDFAGWRCASCNHEAWPQFVKCGQCSRLMCGCTVILLADGRRTFQCAPDCTGSGVLEGEITSYDGQGGGGDDPRPQRTALDDRRPAGKPR